MRVFFHHTFVAPFLLLSFEIGHSHWNVIVLICNSLITNAAENFPHACDHLHTFLGEMSNKLFPLFFKKIFCWWVLWILYISWIFTICQYFSSIHVECLFCLVLISILVKTNYNFINCLLLIFVYFPWKLAIKR